MSKPKTYRDYDPRRIELAESALLTLGDTLGMNAVTFSSEAAIFASPRHFSHLACIPYPPPRVLFTYARTPQIIFWSTACYKEDGSYESLQCRHYIEPGLGDRLAPDHPERAGASRPRR